jgi:hypothetical protein
VTHGGVFETMRGLSLSEVFGSAIATTLVGTVLVAFTSRAKPASYPGLAGPVNGLFCLGQSLYGLIGVNCGNPNQS